MSDHDGRPRSVVLERTPSIERIDNCTFVEDIKLAHPGYLSKRELIDSPKYQNPHVVLLGAGASRAALPNGDRHGRCVPLMDQLPCVLGDAWHDLAKHCPKTKTGFEAQFTWLRDQSKYHRDLDNIEKILYQYFLDLELPDCPTLYDYLVLGLRQKDMIATFNWDPFLMLAHRRNRHVANLPDIRFLHGCVCYATCKMHDILGYPDEACPKCGEILDTGNLFFPDKEKDYTRDSLVWRDWGAVRNHLKEAFHLTIFGYSGPASDYKARELLLERWEASPWRKYSHVEIIDLNCPEVLRENWRDFIPFHHEFIVQCFWNSTIAKWPRRTAEYKVAASLDATPSEEIGPYRADSLEELQEWHLEMAGVDSSER